MCIRDRTDTLNFCIQQAEDAITNKDKLSFLTTINRNLKQSIDRAIDKGIPLTDAKVNHISRLIEQLNQMEHALRK